MSKFDLLATLTAFSARSIALNYGRHLAAAPDAVVLAGGGAENPVLRSQLGAALLAAGVETTLLTSADAGWPSHSIESAAFAWLLLNRFGAGLSDMMRGMQSLAKGDAMTRIEINPCHRQNSNDDGAGKPAAQAG